MFDAKLLLSDLKNKLSSDMNIICTVAGKITGTMEFSGIASITDANIIFYSVHKDTMSYNLLDILTISCSHAGITIVTGNNTFIFEKIEMGDFEKFVKTLLVKTSPKEMRLEGNQSKTVVLKNNSLVIAKKKGLFNTEREKAIPINGIAGIEIKKPGPLIVGYIQFQTAGSIVAGSSYTYTGGAFSAVNDENSVVFSDMQNYEMALKIKQYIEGFNTKGTENTDNLLKLKQLLDAEAISLDEYNNKKREILNRL